MAFGLFIINEEIIFDANSCELKSLNDTGEVIVLNAPTARCLQLLIEKKGEVASRDCFMEQVWQVRGIVVSQNTFYQNISLLRKSLKKVGLMEEIIVTVRRKGFTLAMDTRIQPIEDEKSVQVTEPVLVGANAKQQSPLPEVSGTKENINATNASLQQVGNKSELPKWLIGLLIVFIFLELLSLIFDYLNR